MTVHLHADTDFFRLFNKINRYYDLHSVLLIYFFSSIIPFPIRVTQHALFSYVLLNAKLIMEGVTGK